MSSKTFVSENYFPIYSISPQEANYELVRGHGELIDLAEAEGRVALEGEFLIRRGFLAFSRGKMVENGYCLFHGTGRSIQSFSGFHSGTAGVYMERAADGKFHVYAQVLKKEYEKIL